MQLDDNTHVYDLAIRTCINGCIDKGPAPSEVARQGEWCTLHSGLKVRVRGHVCVCLASECGLRWILAERKEERVGELATATTRVRVWPENRVQPFSLESTHFSSLSASSHGCSYVRTYVRMQHILCFCSCVCTASSVTDSESNHISIRLLCRRLPSISGHRHVYRNHQCRK